jgi:hypothetical protein
MQVWKDQGGTSCNEGNALRRTVTPSAVSDASDFISPPVRTKESVWRRSLEVLIRPR